MFSSIELGVGFIFASMLEPADRGISIVAISACRSFEAKMKLLDATAAAALKAKELRKWRGLSGRIGRKKEVRDKLAHWAVSHWPGASTTAQIKKMKPALVPPIWTAAHMRVMWLPQRERDVHPVFLRDLQTFNESVIRLTTDLFNFSIALSEQKLQPESGEDCQE